LVATGMCKLLLNLADLTQVDTSAVSIIGTYISLRNRGGDLKLLCPRGRMLEVLRVQHLLEVIPSLRMRPKRWPASGREVTQHRPECLTFAACNVPIFEKKSQR